MMNFTKLILIGALSVNAVKVEQESSLELNAKHPGHVQKKIATATSALSATSATSTTTSFDNSDEDVVTTSKYDSQLREIMNDPDLDLPEGFYDVFMLKHEVHS